MIASRFRADTTAGRPTTEAEEHCWLQVNRLTRRREELVAGLREEEQQLLAVLGGKQAVAVRAVSVGSTAIAITTRTGVISQRAGCNANSDLEP